MKKSQLKSIIKEVIHEMRDIALDKHAYKFHDFNWMGNVAGFGVPTDIYYGAIFLGTIESEADGYIIRLVDTPHGKARVEQGAKNKFKSKNLAADALHKLWKWARK